MDARDIYVISGKLQPKIRWVSSGETEWVYCGAAGEVKWDVVEDAIRGFLKDGPLLVATTRTGSFETEKSTVISSIREFVGSKDFLIWCEDFKNVIEFNKIGVFRKGVYDTKTRNPNLKISYNKITIGSPDKVKGKVVKYRKGDCMSLNCGNGKFLAAFIAEKFNKYYDFTLIEFYEEKKSVVEDFVNGCFFGCYGEVSEGVISSSERIMLECQEVDADISIEKIGSLQLIEPLEKESYGYYKNIPEVLQHYLEDLPRRKQNTKNFDKLPSQLFLSGRLISMKQILRNLDRLQL